MFKEKVIRINSGYREYSDITQTEKYVLDIFKLASQLLPSSIVKEMNISDILKEVN